MHIALIVKPIENGFGEVTLCDDILRSVVKRTAFVTTLWRGTLPTAKSPMHEPFRANNKDAFVRVIPCIRALSALSVLNLSRMREKRASRFHIKPDRQRHASGGLRGIQILCPRNLSEDPHRTRVVDVGRDELQHMGCLVHRRAACAGINKLDVADSAFCNIPLQFQVLWVEVELCVNNKLRLCLFR